MNKDQVIIPIVPVMNWELVDPRIKQLSYSSMLTLHACPRKYQLYKLGATEDEMDPAADVNQNVTFAFGHVVGEGIQNVLAGWTRDAVIFRLFAGWHADLMDCNEKQNKSIWVAIAAIDRFISLRENGFLDDYELMYYNDKPAVELSFRISFPDGFLMRGFVDAVLRHKITGEVLVLECKTSSSTNLNAASFKNSSQGVGYSVVLDVVAPGLSSYKVLYLVYLTKNMEYEQLPFTKTYLQRAHWIQELLLDIETIKLYESTGVYPMRGESCTDWGRDCEYLSTCGLSTAFLSKKLDQKVIDKIAAEKYDVELTLLDLIEGQLARE